MIPTDHLIAPAAFDPEAHGQRALAKLHNLPFVSFREEQVMIDATKALPLHVLERARVS